MYGGFRDRFNLDKEFLIKMGMAVGISVCIMLIVFFTQGVPKGTYNAGMTRMEQGITTLGSKVADHDTDITDLQGDIGVITDTAGLHTGSIESLDGRLDTAETDIATIEGELAAVGSPPEGYLTGNFTSGNLTLYARANNTGNYTANVHLVFAPPISAGNATTYDEAVAAFYGSVNWTAANVKAYIPVASYNGTDWSISQVWWNIGTFVLIADINTDISILFGGLADTPSFAYVQIHPALK